jgi:hypothetical protein
VNMVDEKLSELGYVHERIDQLIRQVAVEVGLLKMQMGDYAFSREEQTEIITMATNRFWAADAAAAEKFGRSPRER